MVVGHQITNLILISEFAATYANKIQKLFKTLGEKTMTTVGQGPEVY